MSVSKVKTSMEFTVTVHLTATETADETGADVSNVEFETITVNGEDYWVWDHAIKQMEAATSNGDWTDA